MSGMEVGLLVRLTRTFLEQRALDSVAVFIVPLFVLTCIITQLTGASPLTGGETGLASADLGVRASATSPAEEGNGLLLLLEPQAGEIQVPWSAGTPQSSWMSISEDDLQLNETRLRISGASLEARLPLFGVVDPLVIFIEGVTAEEVRSPGRAGALQLTTLRLQSSLSSALSLAGFIVSAFAFGMIIRLPEEVGEEPQ